MHIRELEEQDIEAVSDICMASFTESVAGSLSAEGISSFTKLADRQAFLTRMYQDNRIFVAEGNAELVGVIELKQACHIAMLFVKPGYQRRGIGRALLLFALKHARKKSISVSASLSSVAAYKSYGFECCGDIGETAGLVYQPMTLVPR